MKKLFLLLALVALAFSYPGSGYGGTDQTGSGEWIFDSIKSLGTITLVNGATFTNPHGDTVLVTEAVVKVSGDIRIMGNDLIFGNGCTVVNGHADTLTITEANVKVAGAVFITGTLRVDDLYVVDSTFHGGAVVDSGNHVVLGDLTVTGETNLGDAATDTVTVTGVMKLTSAVIDSAKENGATDTLFVYVGGGRVYCLPLAP